MFARHSPNALLVAAVLGSIACGTSDPAVPGVPDAKGQTEAAAPEAGEPEPSATEAGDAVPQPEAAETEGGDAAGPETAETEAGDAGQPEAAATEAATTEPDARDAGDERDASVVADANHDAIARADASDGTNDGTNDGADTASEPSEVVYVATYLGGISAFSIDTETGALGAVPGSPFDNGAGFYAMAVTTSGHFAYAADYLHDVIDGYRIARNGALETLPSSPVHMVGKPIGLTVDPAERFVFAASSDGPSRIFVHRIDRTTGALTPVDHSPFAMTDPPGALAVDPQSRFLFVSSGQAPGIRVFAIGDASGALTEVEGSPFGTAHVHGGATAFSQVGNFVYNGGMGVNGFTYDTASGAMTEIDGSPFGQAMSDPMAGDIATDSTGGFVLAVHTFNQTLSAFTMDQGTGRLARVPQSPFPAAPSPYSVGIDPSDRFAFVGNDDVDRISVFSIEATPGDGLRQVAGSPFFVHGLQPEFAFVRFP